MPPLAPSAIAGIWGTLLLPLNEDESIDFARLRDEIDAFLDAGVDGIYSNGSAGEFYAQSEDEFDRVSALLAEICTRRNRPFQIGVCHTSAQGSLARLRRALALQPGALQVVLPDWFAPTIDEAVDFLRRMADAAAPIGLVVYNPLHAKRVLTAAEWLVVADRVPGIVGLKVAGGDASWYAEMRPLLRRLSVFVPGHFLASGYAQGAAGSYSNVACLSPRGARRWFELMHADPVEALARERRIQAFFKTHIIPFLAEQRYTNSAVDKLLAAIGGWAKVGTRLRWPYRWIDETEALRLREIAFRELPELMNH